MKITAPDLLRFGIVDRIIPEPGEGAHTDYQAAANAVHCALSDALDELEELDLDRLVERRAERYHAVGVFARAGWPAAG
jgi:acetyl-CoA carboxylase alpha subunit